MCDVNILNFFELCDDKYSLILTSPYTKIQKIFVTNIIDYSLVTLEGLDCFNQEFNRFSWKGKQWKN